MAERSVRYSLFRDGTHLYDLSAIYSEKAPGYMTGDPFLKPEMTMRAVTTAYAQPGDIIMTSDGARYRVGATERIGRRLVLELSREA
jgi:hypothetical protein